MHRVALRVLRQGALLGAAGGNGSRLAPAPWWPAAALQRRPRGRSYITAPITAVATPWHQSLPGVAPDAAAVAPVQPLLPRAPAALGAALRGRASGMWQLYLQSLARRPLLTKAATSFVCCVIGDSIAQALGGAPYSVMRVLRLATYSSTVGATTGHIWHRWLDANICPDNPTSSRAVMTKTLYDQLLLTPVMTAVFFTAVKLMEGRPDAIVPFLQEKYLQTLLAGYAVWGPWNVLSFKFIPQDLRILAGNAVGILWGTFVSVSCINNRPATADTCSAAAASMSASGPAQPIPK